MKVSIDCQSFLPSKAHVPAAGITLAQRVHRGLVGTIAVAIGITVAAGCGSVDTPAAPDAAPDATPAPPPDAPDPTCTEACLSETSLRECTSGERTVECPLGCVTAEARCAELVPSNGVGTEHLMGVTEALTIAEAAQVIIDTNLGSITVGGQEVRGAGVGVNNGIGFQYTTDGLSVLAVQGMTMGAGSNLRARGERPLLILSVGDVEIAGTIDVSAGCDSGGAKICGGPGGGRGADANAATGCGPGGNGSQDGTTNDVSGGGGGGSGQAGAPGAADGAAAGGSGGQACEASLVPLRGGSGGGRGGSTSSTGGGGGGAVQITSYTAIRLVSPAIIDAGGSGGRGGIGGNGGGGGGGGGGILLEAPKLSIDGAVLAANGGGGGGSSSDGADGRRDVQQAAGGSNGGGLGGALAGSPTPGTASGSAGGGGGAAGLIHLRAPVAGYSLTNTSASPAPARLDPEAD